MKPESIRNKGKILQTGGLGVGRVQLDTHKGLSITMALDFTTVEDTDNTMMPLKFLKHFQPRFLHLVKLSFKDEVV